MKVLLDTNIILDNLLRRAPSIINVRKIYSMIADDLIEACVTANSITDIYYSAKKRIGNTTAIHAINTIILTHTIISIDKDDCVDALHSTITDFEDALIVICGMKNSVDYIITNDQDFLKEAAHMNKVITPLQLLEKVIV